METQNSFNDFLKDLDSQNIKYSWVGKDKIKIAGTDSINGRRSPFIISSDLTISDDPYAPKVKQPSWTLVNNDGEWIAKGINHMYRDQYFGFKKKEPEYFEHIEIEQKPKRKITTGTTRPKTIASKSSTNTTYRRIITDIDGNILKTIPIIPQSLQEADTLKQQVGQKNKIDSLEYFKLGNKINYLNIF